MANNEYYPQAALFTSNDVKQAFAVCILRNLAFVKAEADTTPNHANRIAFANTILVPGQEWEKALALVPGFIAHILSAGGIISGDGTKNDWDYAFAVHYDAIANQGLVA